MALLDKVKTALRVSGTTFDDEVADLIEAAKADLQGVGVKVDDTDPLHRQAIVCFCKARYGYEDPNMMDRYWAAYEAHKVHLAVRAGVNVDSNTEPQPVKDPLSKVDLSKLSSAGTITMNYGSEEVTYTFHKVDGGYTLTTPDGKEVFFDTVDEDASDGGDSPCG